MKRTIITALALLALVSTAHAEPVVIANSLNDQATAPEFTLRALELDFASLAIGPVIVDDALVASPLVSATEDLTTQGGSWVDGVLLPPRAIVVIESVQGVHLIEKNPIPVR